MNREQHAAIERKGLVPEIICKAIETLIGHQGTYHELRYLSAERHNDSRLEMLDFR